MRDKLWIKLNISGWHISLGPPPPLESNQWIEYIRADTQAAGPWRTDEPPRDVWFVGEWEHAEPYCAIWFKGHNGDGWYTQDGHLVSEDRPNRWAELRM